MEIRMNPSNERRLTEDNAIFQTIGVGLYALVVTLLEERLRAGGDNKEEILMKLQTLLSASVTELRACTIGLPISEVERGKIEVDARQRISSMLDQAYRSAREHVGLAPELPSKVH